MMGSATVQLSWRAVTGATYYGLGVRDLASNALVVNTNVGSAGFSAALQPGRQYRWNVAACNASGCSTYTTALYFQTPAPAKTLSSVSLACPATINEGATGSCSAMARFSDNSTQNVTSVASWSENSAFATISSAGVLTATQVTSNQAVTVTAGYTHNGVTKSGTAAVTIVDVPPAKTLSSVSLACPATINEGATGSCSATARFSDNSTQAVTSAAAWSENSVFATISSAGVLTATQVTSNQAVTVTAGYTHNGVTKSGTAAVTIVDVPPAKTLSSVSLACPATINEGATGSCSATARFSDNSTQAVTSAAAWSENSAYATVSSAGVLTAAQVTGNQAVTVTAGYAYNGVTKSGTAAVTIVDVPVANFLLNVGTNGTGAGKVTSNVGGISCGGSSAACSASYRSGTTVVLTATPDAGTSSFTAWGGACYGTAGNTCSLVMVAPRSVTTSVSATFTLRANQPPAVNSAVVTQNTDGSVTLTFTASDPDGGAMGADAYLSNQGGVSFNAASKMSISGVTSGSAATIKWTRAQADQFMVAGRIYTIALDVFDTQAAKAARKVSAAFNRSAAVLSLNEQVAGAARTQVGGGAPRSLARIATLFDELDAGRTNTSLRGQTKTWLTDLEDGSAFALQDGLRMRNAIQRYATWEASPVATRESLAAVKTRMATDLGQADTSRRNPPPLYDATRRTALANRVVSVWDAKRLAFNQRSPGAQAPVVPASDQETLDFMGIRAQCFEWVATVGLRSGAKSIGYSSQGVANRADHRAGMAMFWYTSSGSGAHAAIITSIEADASGNPTYYHVAESNFASVWQNPVGSVPWERAITSRRIPAVANQVNSPTNMSQQGRVVRFVALD